MRDGRMIERADASFQSGLAKLRIAGADFSRRYLCHANFSQSRIERTSFKRCNLRGADFSGCELIDVDFGEALLHGVSFRSARLERARFDGAQLFCCAFDDARLEGSPLKGAAVCLQTFDTFAQPSLALSARRSVARAALRAERLARLGAWAPYAAARYLRNRLAKR